MYSELDPRHDLQPHLPRILNRDVYYKGQTIIEQGTGGFHAYYIEKGRVEVIVKEGLHAVKIAELGKGEIFGEMAVIEDEMRSATVIALEDTTLTVISAKELERKLVRIEDKAIQALMHVFIDRLRHANEGQLHQYMSLINFQDRVTGLVEKAAYRIDDKQRDSFRREIEPLMASMEELLEKYRVPQKR